MNFIPAHFNCNDDRLVSCFDELPFWSAPFGLQLLDMIDYRSSLTVLDIGSGTGFPALELAMRLGEESVIYGIDPWRAAARRLRRKSLQYSIGNIIIIEGAAGNLPFSDHSISLIVSNNGLNNVPDPEAALRECGRVARPGCQLVVTMNLDTTMSEFYDIFRTSLRENGLAEHIVNIDRHIADKRPPIAEIERHCRSAGFIRSKEVHDTFSYTFASGTALFRHYFFRLAFIDAWASCVPEAFRAAILSDVTNRINIICRSRNNFSLSIPFACLEFRKQ